MSFAVLTAGAKTLNVDKAPVVLDRFSTGGAPRYVEFGLDGQPIVTQYTLGSGAPSRAELRLQLGPLSASQVADLDDILGTSGTISVLTTSTGSPIVCAAAPRDKQKIEPVAGHYRDDLALADMMQWMAEITLIRL